MSNPASLQPVQASELACVAGGTTTTTSTTNTQVQALQTVSDSLADLKRQQTAASSSSLTQLLPILFIARARQNG